MKTKVYIFGAGASKPAGAPLLKEFMWEGLFHLTHGTSSSDGWNDYPNFFEFLERNYHFDRNSHAPYAIFEQNGTNIEQILSSIDEEISQGNQDLTKAREEAVRFVYLTLENSIKDGPAKNCYDFFIDKRIGNVNDQNVIITFNYETLYEKALSEKYRGCFSYGIDVDKDKIINFPSYEKSYKNDLLILKLHGSLNWAICLYCSKTHLFWSQKYDHIFEKVCEGCKNHLEPVLIPPTKSKKSRQLETIWRATNLEALWKIAKDKITSADKITIIGHSLNDYDIEALNLIIDAIKSNEKVPSLFIADPAAEEIHDKIFSKTSKKLKDFKGVCLFDCFEAYLNE